MFKKYLGIEILGIIGALVAALLFSISPLADYDLQVVGILFILYFFAKKFWLKKRGFMYFEVLIFVFIIVSTVFATGGLNSPFFFLLYFLLFAIALILEPITSLVLTIVLVIVFLGIADAQAHLRELLPVFSLPFIAPFAKYMGDLQQRYYRQKDEIKALAKSKNKSESVMHYEKEQTLIFLTTVLHRHLDDMKDKLNNFLGDNDLDYLKNKTKELDKVVDGFKEYVEKIN